MRSTKSLITFCLISILQNDSDALGFTSRLYTQLINGNGLIHVPPEITSPSVSIIKGASQFDSSILCSLRMNPIEVATILIESCHLHDHLHNFEHMHDSLVQDMTKCILLMKDVANSAEHSGSLQLRLTLVNSVKCPKWHEDNVHFRLLKTYKGKGTEWCNPELDIIRFINYIRRDVLDMDAVVFPDDLISTAEEGSVLIIRGKKGQGTPVLHRSPECDETTPRLLLTISLG